MDDVTGYKSDVLSVKTGRKDEWNKNIGNGKRELKYGIHCIILL